jgi:hypothetical protein
VTGTLGPSGPGDRAIRAYFDLLAFSSGPAQVYVFAAFWASRPQSANERRLVSLLYSRAKAHKL